MEVTSAPDAPTALRVLARRNRTVTLAWDAPLTEPAPSAYVIEGGVLPGEVLGAIPVDGAETALTFEAPVGQFLVRVHAIAGGLRSTASNEIPLVVEASGLLPLAAPSALAHLLGTVDGDTLTLSWTPTLTGGQPSRVWLQVSGALSGALALPPGETFTIGGVPPGAYVLTLTAENAVGMSAPSNPVTLTFPGTCTAPDPPTDFRSWQAGGRLSVAWNPPRSGAAVTGYTVHVNGDLALSFDTTDRLISAPLPSGQYAVRVVALNACGRSTPAPAPPDWTVALRQGATHVVHWKPVTGVQRYRVFWSSSASDLEPVAPSVPYVDAAASPVSLTATDPSEPVYYRVFNADGAVAAGGGPIAVATTFATADSDRWSSDATPGLSDLNGDGCLDLVGGWGNCDGTFQAYTLDTAGLLGLSAGGRINRDSRFADLTGDGITDIISNIYDRADTTPFATMLHVGDGHGGFTEDPGVAAMQIRGFGETIVTADFDNDGDIDVFLPYYSHMGDGGRNWLLINDGAGHFTDVAGAAGVAFNLHVPPEGAQAIDFNQDGWLDIHVASHLFLNNGDLTFTDVAGTLGLPILFEEGMRLFDVDLDGDLDLVHHDSLVTRLFTNDGGTFGAGQVISGTDDGTTFGYGLNVCDVNGDGFEDVIVANNRRLELEGVPVLLVNVGGRLLPSDLDGEATFHDLVACADLDGSGLPDVVHRWTEKAITPDGQPDPYFRFRSLVAQGTASGTIRLRVVGGGGARNQQGRAVRLRPLQGPDVTITRTVESGSGYMAQNPYDLLVATPWPGTYQNRSPVQGRLGAHDGHARGGADHLRGRAGGLRPAVGGAVATRRLLPPT